MDFTKPDIKLEITKLREILGKCGDDIPEATAKSYGWKDLWKLDTRNDCVIGKAKQKKINKSWSQGIKTLVEKQYIDITLIKGRCFGGPKLWTLFIVD